MNRKLIFPLFIVVLSVASCNEKKVPLDACGCAKERYHTGLQGENIGYCDSLRRENSQFESDFQKCYFALNFGKDTVNSARNEQRMEVIAGPKTGGYAVSTTESKIQWVGREASGKTHVGTIGLKSGNIEVENGRLKGGQMVMDMVSLSNTDLSDAASKTKLEGHLKSADFFDVANFPEASLTITTITERASREYTFTGNLTIKGITNTCTGDINMSTDGSGKIAAGGMMKFDRSLFNVKFRSGKFETGLGDKLINDEILVHFNIQAAN